jgi:hypothetical protein
MKRYKNDCITRESRMVGDWGTDNACEREEQDLEIISTRMELWMGWEEQRREEKMENGEIVCM